MRKTKKVKLFYLLLLLGVAVHGQDIPTGTWRSHFSYNNGQKVALTNEGTFCASQFGLFFTNGSTTSKIDKSQGLSSFGVTAMEFATPRNQLAIGYSDGTIDLVNSTDIQSITTLRDVNIPSSKSINDFEQIQGQSFAATDLGIALLDLNDNEVRDVYREIGPNGNPVSATSISSISDSIYALTNEGVLAARLSDNLLDFNNWNVTATSLSSNFSQILSLGSDLYALGFDIIYEKQNQVWDTLLVLPEPFVKLISDQNTIYGLSKSRVYRIENEVTILHEGDFQDANDFGVNGQDFWVADGTQGLVRVSLSNSETIIPDGPASDNIAKMAFIEDEVWAFHSTPNGDSLSTFSVFRNGRWSIDSIPDFLNVSDAILFNDQIFVASLTDGLYNYSADQKVVSALIDAAQITDLNQLSDQLWMTNYDNQNSILTMSSQGLVEGVSSNLTSTRYPTEIEVSLGNVAWMQRGGQEGGGLSVFDPLDNQVRLVNSSDGLPTNVVLDHQIDLEDEIWIGTGRGPVLFTDATFAFDTDPAFVPFFDNSPLFENEPVNAIVFDGGNRRWFGTERGLWAFDEFLREQLYHFTSANSILPSDEILSLAYSSHTGELFIITSKGLVSYQTDSSEPLPENNSVRIYPNPVKFPDSNRVTISGIVGNAIIKITTVEGMIVDEINAKGSTASWNLRSHSGSFVSSGVYLVWSSDINGEETFIGKIAVIR